MHCVEFDFRVGQKGNSCLNMASIRLEDRLDGISNYLQCKVRMTTIFKENKPWAPVTTVIVPPSNDPIALDIHEVKEAKA